MNLPPLPELPEPKELYLPTHIQRYYDPADVEDLMRAYALSYGRAVQKAEAERTRALVLDDAWALTFQTFGQYRTALARAIRNGVIREGEGNATNHASDAD